jgi:acetylornithine deacetylase/succinyl-diaminopimelate desuccinylase-like protein
MVLKHPKLFKPFVTAQLRKFPELFSLFSNTITVTNIYSDSDVVNKLSLVAGAQLDCRLLPETDQQEFLASLRKLLKDDNIKIEVIKSQPKSVPSSSETVFFKNLSLAIQEKYPTSTTMDMMMPNVNDLGIFRLDNIPAYGTMPIFCDLEEVRCVHGKNEHLHLESLYNGAEVYHSFLRKMLELDNVTMKQ